MATVKTFLKGQSLSEKVAIGGRSIWAENYLDFSATNVDVGDVVQAIKIPAGARMIRWGAEVLTAESATCTATVGDAGTAHGWDAELDLNSATGQISLEATDTDAATTMYYGTADTIDLTMGHDTDTAIMCCWAEYFMSERYSG